MTRRTEAATEATQTNQTTTGRHSATAPIVPTIGDIAVRDLVVAGGLLGFTPKELFA